MAADAPPLLVESQMRSLSLDPQPQSTQPRRLTNDGLTSSQEFRQQVIHLRDMVPGNNECADCGAPEPEWTSISLGIFICVHCCGVHRHIGTHISRVRSIKLDEWTEDSVRRLHERGNQASNAIYAYSIPPAFRRPRAHDPPYVREEWIRDKYGRKQFTRTNALGSEQLLPVKGGYLMKKSRDGNKWAQRFFKLSKDKIYYYKDVDEVEYPLGAILVAGAKIFIADHVTQRPFSIQIIDTTRMEDNDRSYFIAADSAEQVMCWLNLLRHAKAILLNLHTEELLQTKGIAISQPGATEEYERMLGCELVTDGWMHVLDVSPNLNQLLDYLYRENQENTFRLNAVPQNGQVTTFTAAATTTTAQRSKWISRLPFGRSGNNSPSIPRCKWQRYWVTLDYSMIRFYKSPLSPFPLSKIPLSSRFHLCITQIAQFERDPPAVSSNLQQQSPNAQENDGKIATIAGLSELLIKHPPPSNRACTMLIELSKKKKHLVSGEIAVGELSLYAAENSGELFRWMDGFYRIRQ